MPAQLSAGRRPGTSQGRAAGIAAAQENRSQAAWREVPSALPIASHFTPRWRNVSTSVCRKSDVESITSDEFPRLLSRCSSVILPRSGAGSVLVSPLRILLQSVTHSSQMNTAGPAITALTLSLFFPQNEQNSSLPL